MKFLRRFAAVTLMVAVVVGIGLAWNHFAPSTLIGKLPGFEQRVAVGGPAIGKGHIVAVRPPGGQPRKVIVLTPGAHPPAHLAGNPIIIYEGPMDLGLTSMFERVNWPIVERAVVIEALVIAAVVALDRIRLRLRRARRNRAAARGVPSTDG